MTPPWSAEQRSWLQALGHEVLALATPAGVPGESPAADLPRVGDDAPVPPLLRALQRAAGGADARTVSDLIVHFDALRISPAAKRALWPRLRALRKARR